MNGKLTQVLLAMTAVTLVSGCASLPSYNQISSRFPQIAQGQGRIYFNRAKGLAWARAGVTTKILLNDHAVGNLTSDCLFYVDRPAGDHLVGCQTGLLEPEQGKHESTFMLGAGETKYVRVTEHLGVVTADAEPTLENKDSGIRIPATGHYTSQK